MKRFLIMILVVAAPFLIVGCSDENNTTQQPGPTPNTQPAIASVNPTQLSLGQKNATVSIQGTNLGGVTAVSMGNGITVHGYNQISASEVNVNCTVLDTAGAGQRTISVTTTAGTATNASAFSLSGNRVPEAKFTVSSSRGSTATVFEFDASGTVDKASVASYSWDYGDGSSGKGKKTTHKYSSLGDYTVVLTVSDDKQGTSVARKQLEIIKNKPPVANFTVTPGAGSTNTTFTFNASASRDPDGRISSYNWTFDGSVRRSGMIVTYKFELEGKHTVALSVTDDAGISDGHQKDVKVDKVTSNSKCPAPAFMKGKVCCHGGKCCSEKATNAGSIGWCSGRIMCTAGKSGYQPPLPGFDKYPGKDCSQFPALW